MKIETQILEDHQAKLTVEFDAEALAAAKRRSAQQLAKKYKIPGFRPGKAPYAVVERYIGEEAIVENAIEVMMRENYPKVIKEAGIKPYGPGTLQEVKSLEPPTFEFVVPLDAEVTLGDYRSLRIPYEAPALDEEDVAKVLEDLRDRQAIIEPVERPVQVGDEVHLKLSAQRKQVEEGQNATLIQERHQPLVVLKDGEDDRDEWPFPGFSRKLVGASVGEEITLEYTYPEDYVYENLRGVTAEFHAVVEEVKSRTLPALDDEFAKSISDADTLDELRNRIRESLQANKLAEYNREYTDKIMAELLNQSTVKFPPQMHDEEIDTMVREIASRLEQRGLSLETYLKSRQMDEKAFREETRPAAEARLKRSLILREISRREKIEVKAEEVQTETVAVLNQLGQGLSTKEARRLANDDFIYQLVGDVTADLFAQRTVERLHAIAKGEEVEPQPEAAVASEEGISPEVEVTPSQPEASGGESPSA